MQKEKEDGQIRNKYTFILICILYIYNFMSFCFKFAVVV